ncbi:MAG: STAS domain-containing protein [Candidatus Riflebacteria bacterium]|nr:STAS domain-containing protein [Candidatus Riflebacteria bacterium]
MIVNVRTQGEFIIISPLEDVTMSNIKQLDNAIAEQIGLGETRLILDFSLIRIIDSSGIGIIVKNMQLLRDKNGEIRLAAVSDSIMRIFKMINFHKYFKITSTLEEALNP